jgi:hypothetical protein
MFSTKSAGEPLPTLIAAHKVSQGCSPQLSGDVGAVRQAHVEDELDLVIRELGEKAVQALRNEDPTGARILTNRMYAAIASRTPEHQARLTAEVEQRITDGLDYFQSPADLAMGRLYRNA